MTPALKILVIGGTGMLGAPVVESLAAAGHAVRLLARNPSAARERFGQRVEVLPGDVEDEASLARALGGCEGVHVNLAAGMNPINIDRIEHQGTARVARLAAQAGVQRFTYLSGGHTSDQPIWDAPSHLGMTSIAKSRAEYAIRECGVPYTIFRATMFMETLPVATRGGRAVIFGDAPEPFHWLAARDYAQMVASAFAKPDAANRTLYPRGPEALTLPAAFKLYRQLARPELKITRLPNWTLSAAATLVRRPAVGEMVKMLKTFGTVPEMGDPSECDRLLGKARTRLDQWCRLTIAS